MTDPTPGELAADALNRAVELDLGVADIEPLAAGEHYRVYASRRVVDGEQLVVRLPRRAAGIGQPGRVRRAAGVLEILAERSLPFEVPRTLGFTDTAHGLAVVETRMDGVELAEAALDEGLSAADITARVAAACHRLDAAPFREVLDDPGGNARLLHGDLLPQNILVDTSGDELTISVVDWDAVRLGDPEEDLKAVIRGYDTVFSTGETAEDLREAYEQYVAGPPT